MKRMWLVVPASLALASPALAEDGPDFEAHHQERLQETLDAVDASPEQREQVHEILQTAGPELRSFREEGRLLKDEVHALFEADQIDRVALEDVRLDLVDLFDRFTSTAFETMADLSEVFSAEQREELRQLREERHQRWRERWTHLRG